MPLVAGFALLEQEGDVWDGSLVLAFVSGASRLECWSTLLQCMFLLAGKERFSGHLCCRCCTQRTDVPAVMMRFCVQLLSEREAPTLSSQNP